MADPTHRESARVGPQNGTPVPPWKGVVDSAGGGFKIPPISTAGSVPPSETVITQVEALRCEPGRPSQCDVHAELIATKLEIGLTAQRIY